MVDSKTTIAPYDRISDVNVIMTVVHPKPVVGLGNLLILNAVTGSESTNKKPDAPTIGDNGTKTQPTQPDGNDQSTQPTDKKESGSDTESKDDGSQKTSVSDAKFQTVNVKSLMSSLAEKKTDTPSQKALPDESSNEGRLNGLLMRKTDPATGAMYREYKNLDAVAVDYKEDTDVWKKASAYFAQDYHSDRVAVLDYDPSKAYDALKAFWYFNWTFACLSKSTNDPSDFEALKTLSNIFEVNKDHFLVLQTTNLQLYVELTGQNYTIGLEHDIDQAMDTAFVGAIATRQIGATTWKFKELHGIQTEKLTTQELAGINNVHAIAYTEVRGRGETTEGWVLSGEYIDLLHGVLWVQTEMSGQLEDLLQTNSKIPYDQSGINMISGVASRVLEEATQMGIVLTDDKGKGVYTVTATPREDQSAQDLSARHYGGMNFVYHAGSAVHTITVHGTVNSDTIIQ